MLQAHVQAVILLSLFQREDRSTLIWMRNAQSESACVYACSQCAAYPVLSRGIVNLEPQASLPTKESTRIEARFALQKCRFQGSFSKADGQRCELAFAVKT